MICRLTTEISSLGIYHSCARYNPNIFSDLSTRGSPLDSFFFFFFHLGKNWTLGIQVTWNVKIQTEILLSLTFWKHFKKLLSKNAKRLSWISESVYWKYIFPYNYPPFQWYYGNTKFYDLCTLLLPGYNQGFCRPLSVRVTAMPSLLGVAWNLQCRAGEWTRWETSSQIWPILISL